jgi:perosamine synthetase
MIPLAQPQVGRAEVKALERVVRSRVLASGREVGRFESGFARYLGAPAGGAVACANGTAALHAALRPLGLKPRDEVLTTPFTFIATANSILHAGAKPRFADVDPFTYNLDPRAAKASLDRGGARVKAILVVHLFGHPADLEALGDLCRRKGIALVEDCAQAHGAMFGGRRVGTFGRTSAFSFYATKNLPCGEGGMVVCRSARDAATVRSFVNHGRGPGGFETVGYNYRLNNLAAAVGLCQLGRLEAFNAARRRNAALYRRELAGVKGLVLPVEWPGVTHVYHQFTVLAPGRDALGEALRERGVDSRPFYARTVPQEPAYRALGHGRRSYPVAEDAARRCLSLPVHPGVTEKQVRLVSRHIRAILGA